MAERKPGILVLVAESERELPGLEALRDEASITYANREETVKKQLPSTDILVVADFRTGMLERVWPDEHRLRWVHATSAGVDALMFPALAQSDIPVTNARGIFDRGIAEYVLGAILLFAKDFMGNLRLQQSRYWQHRETELIDAREVLVVGAGSIGREVASLLRAAGMRVYGTARSDREQPPFEHVYAQEKLPELLPSADYVVITAPLTAETEGLFDAEMLRSMKPGARLINVARGPIVKTDDLVQALQEQVIDGAALDVFEEEPLPAGHPLWQMPQVMISAHMAGDFIGWREALAQQFIDNFRRWQKGEEMFNLVDKQQGFSAGD